MLYAAAELREAVTIAEWLARAHRRVAGLPQPLREALAKLPPEEESAESVMHFPAAIRSEPASALYDAFVSSATPRTNRSRRRSNQ
jgi:hypothetical protein